MLRSIKQLYGDKLKATDGEIGSIRDFYFDDVQWVVRYVVVDTGSWLSGHLVLISPRAFINFNLDGVSREVNLTQKQIENSPGYDSNKPVSRQCEEDHSRYYGWPDYWQDEGLLGIGSFSISEPPYHEGIGGPSLETVSALKNGDAHLRSTKTLKGYEIQTEEGAIGHVIDFIVDHENWGICHVVVETGHWFLAREIIISPKQIVRISYEESKIFVSVSKESILKAPEYHVPPWAFSDVPICKDK